MSGIRPLRADDIGALAALFQEVFRDRAAPPPASLAAYLRWHYLDMPGCDPEIAPLVHVEQDGRITGFIGLNAQAMTHGGRTLRAGIASALMVSDNAGDKLAGARLVKAALAGPQDITLTETASDVSARMWVGARGALLPQYSLDWIRVLRPGSYLVDLAAGRIGAARLLAPFGRGLDRVSGRRAADAGLSWSGLPDGWVGQGALSAEEVDAAAFAALVEPLTEQYPLRPVWREGQLDTLLACARQKPDWGELVLAAANTRGGKPVGAFAYYVRPGRVCRVLQVLALPGQAGPVLDCLLGDALRRGVVALRGRTQPALMEAMLGRRVAFLNEATSLVHSRDDALVEACRNGALFFNGLAGEYWSRLVGGSFD
ncbi:MAG: hypothetical protein M9945_07445 [Aquamicrobium sp.]|uniref:hypothetical protein n=1 Tax=Aquamicrobium sp. TaxID=1872579 RepID=UPI00349E54D9|nr:hypothetical protein [Aquamicrobium sp.]